MSTVVNTVSAFTIAELTGPQRSIRLVGRGLPYRPYRLSGAQRVEVTWLPGYSEATATILGPTEDKTTINGWWKDKYLGQNPDPPSAFGNLYAPFVLNGEPVDNVRDAARVIDDMRRMGQQIQVTWDEQVRVGHLAEFEQNWHNTHDLEYAISFAWISRGEQPAGIVITESSLADAAFRIRRLHDAVNKAGLPSVGSGGFDLNFGAKLLAKLQKLSDSVQKLQNTFSNAVNAALSPVNAARLAFTTFNGMITQCADLKDQTEAQVSGAIRFRANLPGGLASQSFSQRLGSNLYTRNLSKAATDLRNESVEQRDALAAQLTASGQLLGTYTARAGDDLRDVSRIYYKTPFEWRRLLLFNHLVSAELTPGLLVLVPKLQGVSLSQGG